MSISLTSFLLCIVVTNCLILLLCLLIRYTTNAIYISPHFVIVITALIIVRSFIPYEFFYSITVPNDNVLPIIQRIANHKILYWNIEIYQLFIYIWLTGAIIKLINICRKQIRMQKRINALPNSKYMHILRKILTDNNMNANIDLISIPGLVSPAIVGLKHTKIIIPYDISQKDLYYILLHEIEHYKKKDLYLIIILQLACCVYWWNPLFYILKAITLNTIELRVDTIITNQLKDYEKLDYLQSILNVAKKYTQVKLFVGLGFVERDTNLVRRFKQVLETKRKDYGQLISVIMLILIVISTIVIIEPYSIAQIDSINSFTIPSDSYLIEKNGLYDVYINGNYSFTIDTDVGFSNLPMYHWEEETE